MIELENKYIIHDPNVINKIVNMGGNIRVEKIEHFYILNEFGVECRVSRYSNAQSTKYIMTVKMGVDPTERYELEKKITYSEFLDLFEIAKKQIQKTRIYVECDDKFNDEQYTFEIDIMDENKKDIKYLLEIEFDNEEHRDAFNLYNFGVCCNKCVSQTKITNSQIAMNCWIDGDEVGL